MDRTEFLAELRERLQQAMDAYDESRNHQLDDLKFYAGDSSNQWQWPLEALATRNMVPGSGVQARPTLTINMLPSHVRLITNDQRQNRPSIKVIPVDSDADVEVAEIFDGIIRHIEAASDADVAYDTACEHQVVHGEGYIRILTEYCDDDGFDQDIRIRGVRNPFSVYLDPTFRDPCASDAQWCLITDELTHEEYERQFPDAQPISALQTLGVGDQSLYQWVAEQSIRIAEYFWIERKAATLLLYPGGITAEKGSPQEAYAKAMGLLPIRSREVERKTVKWCKTNGYDILAEGVWPGKHIPIVRVVGNELEIDGRMHVSGLVRGAIDAQRMYNYWVSQEAEMLALAPKAPFVGYAGQFEGYEAEWKTANVANYPYLQVNQDATDGQGNPLPLPQRSMPPMASSGLLQAKAGAIEDIKAVTNQYNASLGQTSNEKSGRAILAREKQADTSSYHYVDNLARAVRYVGRQIVDLIPVIYDTERIARIIGEDGTADTAKLNPQQQEPVRKITDDNGDVIAKIYNPGVGRYDVRVITGPNYASKRQEAVDAMSQLVQGNPGIWQTAGDLLVRAMDWPGAEELAERLKKTIPPELLADDDGDPALLQAQRQMQQMAQQMQAMQAMLQNVQQSMEAQELDIKRYEAETKRIAATAAAMTPDQVQEIVLGTIHAAIQTGDIVGQVPMREEAGEVMQ